MSLKNEIFEGIAAYKALTPTAEDKYKGEMYKIAKRENDDWEERQRAKEEAIAAGRPTTAVPQQIQQNIPTMSRSDAIGPLPPTFPPTQVPTVTGQNMRRGGRVRRFAEGGFMGGLASGIKSTFQAPRALNVNQWTRPPRARDAGIPGSDDIAQDAARRYGSVEAPAAAPAQPSFPIIDYGSTGGTEGTGGVGGSATDGSGGSAAAGVGGDDGGTYRRGGRVKAFDDGGPVGLGSALRGGRPVYNPDEDPNVQERNRADAIIREIISAQVGEPNPANDPSIELRERGERDREANRSRSSELPPWQPVSTEDTALAKARPLPSPPEPTPPPVAPDRAGPTPAAANRADLETKYRSVIPPPAEPEEGDPSAQIMARGEEDRTERRQDDSGLTDYAPDPNNPMGPPTQEESEDPSSRFHRRPYKPNIGPPQALETQVPPTDAAYPATAPGPLTKPTSAAREFIDKNLPHVIPGDRKSTGDEAAADRRWQESINQRRFDLRTNPLEKITPEERARRKAELDKLDAEEAEGSPSERLRARRRAIETGTPASAFVDKEPAPVGPVQAAVEDATKDIRTAAKGVLPIAGPKQEGAPTAPRPPAAAAPAASAPARSDIPTIEATAGAGVQPPAPPGEQYGPPAPAQYGPPAPANPNAPAAPPSPGEQHGPPAPSVGNNTPGGRPGGQPTPPPGSATANRPSTAEKPDTRVAAFDPTVDRVDPSTGLTLPRQLDAQGRAIVTGPPPVAQGDGGPPGSPSTGTITRTSSTQTYGGVDTQPGSLGSATGYTNRDIAQTLNGAATLVRPGVNGGPPPIGHLAASPQAFNAYVQHHNQGGKFTPGEAMLVGMVSDYKMLLKQGRVAQANQMAYGLLQAANIEAASHGMVARDKAMAGDWQGAKQSMVNGLNYIGDGVSQRLSADGQHMESYDPRTGAVTARTPLDGRTILAGIMGLANGDLFWKTLQASAQMLQKPDRGLTGRLLSDELKRRQIALADARLARGSAPRGGSGTSSGMSGFQRDLARIRGDKVSGGGGGGGGGAPDNSDLDIINWNTEAPEPPPE